MNARDREDLMLARCVRASRSATTAATTDEASVFRLAAQLVKTWHPDASHRLDVCSQQYFKSHPSDHALRFDDLVRAGLVTDVSRLRNMLLHQLRA